MLSQDYMLIYCQIIKQSYNYEPFIFTCYVPEQENKIIIISADLSKYMLQHIYDFVNLILTVSVTK